jgi:excisionase family DNA binding protein
MKASTETCSGPCPDLIAKQRSRDGGSSAPEASVQPLRLADHGAAPAALDAPGAAPLPPSLGISNAAQARQASLLHADDVASMLGVSKGWVYAEVRAGRMPYVKLGRYVRFRRESIESWLCEIETATMR